jgi:clan AA aspartic protease
MLGFLDKNHRVYLTADVGQGPLDFLVDTGFNGALVIGAELFDHTHAERLGKMLADLASDQTCEYDTFLVEFDWLGERIQTAILVGAGTECLLGTALLEPHRLEIDYGKGTVELIRGEDW